MLIFGVENWVLSEEMFRNLEGVHVGSLRQVTGRRKISIGTGPGEALQRRVYSRKREHRQMGTYIEKRQETVVYCMALIPILGVCDKEIRYKGRLRRRKTWCRQTADQKQLSARVEDILVAARAMSLKPRRRDESRRGREVAESYVGSNGSWYYGTETGDA